MFSSGFNRYAPTQSHFVSDERISFTTARRIASERYPSSRISWIRFTSLPASTMGLPSLWIVRGFRRLPRQQPTPEPAPLLRVGFVVQPLDRRAELQIAVEPQVVLGHRHLPAAHPAGDVLHPLRPQLQAEPASLPLRHLPLALPV